MLLLAGLGGLSVLPARELAIDPNCKTSGVGAYLKERVQKERFWKGQLEYIDQEIENYEARRESIAQRIKSAPRPSGGRRAIEEFYRKNPKHRPTPSDADKKIAELRAEADELERQQRAARMQQFMQEMTDKYRKCRTEVAARVEQHDP